MNEHKHDYKNLILIKVMGDNPNYFGKPKGILARKCDCGSKLAFEYGNRDEMLIRGQELKAAT